MARISMAATVEVGTRTSDLPKVVILVISDTLEAPLAWSNTRLAKGDLAAEIAALRRQPGDPLRPSAASPSPSSEAGVHYWAQS
jgi:hypothetical protein